MWCLRFEGFRYHEGLARVWGVGLGFCNAALNQRQRPSEVHSQNRMHPPPRICPLMLSMSPQHLSVDC